MRSRVLGRTGLRVGEVGFGAAPVASANYAYAWDPTAPESAAQFTRAVHRAVELGYTVFDTSPCYGEGYSEELLGAALTGRRDQVVLATKTGWRDETEQSIAASLEASLRRLQTDHVDLLQIHGDYGDLFSPSDVHDIIEGGLLASFERMREQGKARFLGVTCEDPTSVIPLVASGHFDAVQILYSLIYQGADRHQLPLCEQQNVGVLVMRSTTSGILPRYLRAAGVAIAEPEALALNYVLSDTRVDCALVGMRSIVSVELNAKLSDDVSNRVDMEWLQRRRVDSDAPGWHAPA